MPQRFGRFWLHEKIGHGGMAEIYRASVGPDPDNYAFDVALKRPHERFLESQQDIDMFFTEADVAKFLRHPNLIQVYESGLVDERPYIVMEYVWGIELGRLIQLLRHRGWRFPSDLAVYGCMQALRALDYIHRAKTPGGETMEMVHRDVTPSNIYVTFNGEVKLGDFGIARVRFLEPREGAELVKGKASYIPPEVLRGEPVHQQVNLWSVAVCMYEMLTGRAIYDGVEDDEIISGVVSPAIEPIQEVNPEIDSELAKLVGRLLSPVPKRRPQDAATFYRMLKSYLRQSGIQVGREALARFVVSATGSADDIQPRVTAEAGEFFESQDYYVPMGMTLTQRYEIIRRRRLWQWPAIVIGAGVTIGGLLVWLLL